MLYHGKKARTRKGFSHNVEVEHMEEGKPLNQSVAIAYSEAKHSHHNVGNMKKSKSRGYTGRG